MGVALWVGGGCCGRGCGGWGGCGGVGGGVGVGEWGWNVGGCTVCFGGGGEQG